MRSYTQEDPPPRDVSEHEIEDNRMFSSVRQQKWSYSSSYGQQVICEKPNAQEELPAKDVTDLEADSYGQPVICVRLSKRVMESSELEDDR